MLRNLDYIFIMVPIFPINGNLVGPGFDIDGGGHLLCGVGEEGIKVDHTGEVFKVSSQ